MIQSRWLKSFVLFCCMAVMSIQTNTISAAANSAANSVIKVGKWTIAYNRDAKTVDYIHDGQTILKGVFVKAKSKNEFIQSTDYGLVSFSEDNISDVFGEGVKYTISYSGLSGKPILQQVFYLYPDKDYFLTEAYIVSSTTTSSNYIAPVVTMTQSSFLDANLSNRVLSVPFDNDGFVRYSSFPLSTDSVSFEVTSIFSGKNRKGLVIGSVEHDTWKTGIRYSTSDKHFINRLECFGGITHSLTRDINTAGSNKPSKVHGSISGTRLKSPKVLVGIFDDWRKGMETYGDVNALIAPPRPWNKGNIFGWNSWGGMADKLNYLGAIDVSDYLRNNLKPAGFSNEGTTYVVLDSYWNNLADYQLSAFVKRCVRNGQVPGIYCCPFSDWGGDPNYTMEGSTYKYKDAYLYVNGQVRKIESLALDPTHPGTQKRMTYYIDRFKKLGFKYIKFDFLNNAILEADSFYDKQVTTGVQAYNKGMEYLAAECGNDIYMALSIAPLFPSQYGNSRRISCDAWGALKDTEYELNSLSFGWWLDRVYPFNDADHLVLFGNSESENRMRITSGVITGTYILGDNFSQKGSYIGDLKAREKAEKFATNADINDIARIGKSFYPLEGYKAAGTNKAEECFVLKTSDYVYLAVFNFTSSEKYTSINLSRLDLSLVGTKTVKELWSGESMEIETGSLGVIVPPTDVKVYRIPIKEGDTDEIIPIASPLTVLKDGATIVLKGAEAGETITIYTATGMQLLTIPADGNEQRIPLPTGALYLVKVGEDVVKVSL